MFRLSWSSFRMMGAPIPQPDLWFYLTGLNVCSEFMTNQDFKASKSVPLKMYLQIFFVVLHILTVAIYMYGTQTLCICQIHPAVATDRRDGFITCGNMGGLCEVGTWDGGWWKVVLSTSILLPWRHVLFRPGPALLDQLSSTDLSSLLSSTRSSSSRLHDNHTCTWNGTHSFVLS